jgi:hypothetical protein
LDCQLPANFSAGLLQLCLLHVPHLDADSLAQLVWAWDRLDGTQDKQLVRQIATAARAQLMPHAYDSLMGVVGAHEGHGAYASASSSSSGRRDPVLQTLCCSGQRPACAWGSNGSLCTTAAAAVVVVVVVVVGRWWLDQQGCAGGFSADVSAGVVGV